MPRGFTDTQFHWQGLASFRHLLLFPARVHLGLSTPHCSTSVWAIKGSLWPPFLQSSPSAVSLLFYSHLCHRLDAIKGGFLSINSNNKPWPDCRLCSGAALLCRIGFLLASVPPDVYNKFHIHFIATQVTATRFTLIFIRTICAIMENFGPEIDFPVRVEDQWRSNARAPARPEQLVQYLN